MLKKFKKIKNTYNNSKIILTVFKCTKVRFNKIKDWIKSKKINY